METVEVLVKLPKDVYETVKGTEKYISGRRSGRTIDFALWNGVINGTVLPKGHGVLKDVTNLMRGLYEEMQTDSKGDIMYTPSDVYRMIDQECPTIIEADEDKEHDN